MSGYFAVPPEVWPAIRERLPRPLSREEALVDLRWWQDRELAGLETMPGYRALGHSWGWSAGPKQDCKRARSLLSEETAWSDPYKLSEWRARDNPASKPKGRTEGARRAQTGRTEGASDNGDTPDIEEKGRIEGASRAHRGRTEGDTREPLSPQTQTQVTDTDTEEQRAHAREAAPALQEAVTTGLSESLPDPVELHRAPLLALQERDSPEHGLCTQRDIAVVTAALLRGVSAEQLEALWVWSGVSEDALVAGCRKGGWRRWSALLRQPTGQARLDAAWAWHRAGRPAATGPPPAPGSRGAGRAGDGVLERLVAKRRAQTEVIDAE
jgi:hypothetical protein